MALLLGLLVTAGCGDDEKEVRKAYARVVFNAKMGNEEAFLDGFTKKSAQLVRGLLALRRNYGDRTNPLADPYTSIVLEEVETVEIKEEKGRDDEQNEIDVKTALVTVTDGSILRQITMIKTSDDEWKIDALANQKLWHEDSKAYRKKR